jgi:hypothetical protein
MAIDLCAEAFADGLRLDYVCGDEVCGSCTGLRSFLEGACQGYVLRVPSSFPVTLATGVKLTSKEAASQQLRSKRRWEIRSAGTGAKGERWYAWAWLATISPRHHLLIRRHLATGELAFCYCHVPEGQPLSLTLLIRAAGLRWRKKISSSARTVSGSTSPRSASTPRLPGIPCWSWPPWPSAPSPPRCCAAALTPRRRR